MNDIDFEALAAQKLVERASSNVANTGRIVGVARERLQTDGSLGTDDGTQFDADGAPVEPTTYWRAGMRVGQAPIK